MAYLCKHCDGTGIDFVKTQMRAKTDADFRHRVKHHGSYIRCWFCNGNGLDPAEYFRWGEHEEKAKKNVHLAQ